ncbi:MAG: hypothetical protein D6705_16815 [Deltaproteobacteria bacterium]|nr:MAG: hypothetical protein D6705_16815 [Deltaproteobacteria bacterium]
MADEDPLAWRERLGATLLEQVGVCRSYQLAPRIFAFECTGHLDSDVMFALFESCWKSPGFDTPYGVVAHVVGETTYDPDLRTFAEREGLVAAAAVAVITDKVIQRMVLSTVGIATRLRHGTVLTTHEHFDDGLAAVERTLASRLADA